jgi:hypothetical protein
MSPMMKRYATMIVGVDVVLVAFHALAHLGAGRPRHGTHLGHLALSSHFDGLRAV